MNNQDSTAKLNAYTRVNVETASQGKLIVMLFNGAIQRSEEARRMLEVKNVQGIHDNLVRAQEIITELRSALDISSGEIALQIDRIYEYILHLLIQGNIKKDDGMLKEAVSHMAEMRDTWKEAFDRAALEEAQGNGVPSAPPPPSGASIMDLKG